MGTAMLPFIGAIFDPTRTRTERAMWATLTYILGVFWVIPPVGESMTPGRVDAWSHLMLVLIASAGVATIAFMGLAHRFLAQRWPR
jgi:hypothetical protein